MDRLAKYMFQLNDVIGIDRAIAYVIAARMWSFISNIGTVLLMLRFLSPLEQGYYFTLIALVTLQAVFELGFSFVILQMAAHERALLTIHRDGSIAGDSIAHARLASVLQLALRWYSFAGILLCATLLPGGILFFAHNARPGPEAASWLFPWILSSASCSVAFILNPFFAFIEGCGQVSQIARLRFYQCLANTVCAWGAMVARRGLYAPGMIILSSTVIGILFLLRRRKLLLGLLRFRTDPYTVSWRSEIWPFQWKIAVSWLCTTYTIQLFTPILFHYRNPVEAGQMGMSLSVIGYISTVVLSWMATKASPFGQLIAQGKLHDLNRIFKSSLRQSISVLLFLDALCMAGVLALNRWLPGLAVRIVSPRVFGVLLLVTLGTAIIQSQAIYLRSFKREPFLFQSMVAATLTLAGVLLSVRHLGQSGVAASYLFGMGIVGVAYSSRIFAKWQRTMRSVDGEFSGAPEHTRGELS